MKKSKLFYYADKLAVIYLIIPFLIFSVTWLKPIYAALCCAVIGVFCYKALFNSTSFGDKNISGFELKTLIIAFAFITLWVSMSGIGCMVFQNEDHIWRNGMYEVLVNENWPITMKIQTDGVCVEKGFSYYSGFWLPSACIGKIFGINIGYKFQMVWAAIGIYLFYIILCKLLNEISLWPLVLFVFFSGMDVVGYYVTGGDLKLLLPTEHIEWWSILFQYSSFTTQLFWVFNQAVPAWLATVLILAQENNRKTILIWTLTLLNCTMPFVGLLPFVIYKIIPSLSKTDDDRQASYFTIAGQKFYFSQWKNDIFTFGNVVLGGIVGIVSLLYLSKGGGMFHIGFINLRGGGWLVYLVFIMVEFGAVWLSVLWAHQNNPLFYITFIWLALCPLLEMYGDKNFCMRASIPALVILFIYVIQALRMAVSLKKVRNFVIIMLFIAIGSVTALHEFNRTIVTTFRVYTNGSDSFIQEAASFRDIMGNEYETADISKNLFFKYLCR